MNARNPLEYVEKLLFILTKEGKLVRLTPKPAQLQLYEAIREEISAKRPPRLLVLKGRQEGISTMTEALMFQDSATRRGVRTLIAAHSADSTSTLFEMNKLFYDCLPPRMQPMRKASNAKLLRFENPTRDKDEKRRRPGLRSTIKCVTAGSKGVGRSNTITNAHLSEFAFWPGDKMATLTGIMQTVPDAPDTLVVIESTANGFEEFQALWQGAVNGENGWKPVFLPWFMEPTYRKPVEPGTVWTDEENQLRERYELSDEQLTWRRWCIKNNCAGDTDTFRQEYPCCPEEAFLMTGRPFFDRDGTMRLLEQLRMRRGVAGLFTYATEDAAGSPPVMGDADRPWGFAEDKKGCIEVFSPPQKGVPYVIGGDTAGEGSDFYTAHVIDNRTGVQVAELRMQRDELLYTRQLFCLGHFYNTALLAVEINYSTYPQKKLEEWRYPRLYQRERLDTFTGTMVKAFGWLTSTKTRPLALSTLKTVAEESPECIRSYRLAEEMRTFVYDDSGKPQASAGMHDDLVMAAAICHMARHQQRVREDEEALSTAGWTADMLEDYRTADAETRRRMREMWGKKT